MSPKINLLPQENAEKAKGRQKAFLGAFFLLGYVVLLAFVFLWVKGRESQAEENLAAQVTANAEVRSEIQDLEPFRILGEHYEEGVINLHAALNGDVSWGVLLDDLGRMISSEHVWVENLGINRVLPDDESIAYGAVQMSGSGFDYPDVASWLVTLDSDDWESVGAAWASSVQQTELDEVETVSWAIQTALSEAALSSRADDLTPEVP